MKVELNRFDVTIKIKRVYFGFTWLTLARLKVFSLIGVHFDWEYSLAFYVYLLGIGLFVIIFPKK